MTGIVTGENLLVDRYPYGNASKVWPVTLASLKEHIQIDTTFDDSLIESLLAAATDEVERRTSMALINQRRIQYVSQSDAVYLQGTTIELTVAPLVTVTAIKYLDADGATQTLAASHYRTAGSSGVYFKSALPALAEGPHTVWVEYEAGFGTTPSAIPPLGAELVKLVSARRYDYRSGDGTNQSEQWDRMIRGLVRIFGDSSHRL